MKWVLIEFSNEMEEENKVISKWQLNYKLIKEEERESNKNLTTSIEKKTGT